MTNRLLSIVLSIVFAASAAFGQTSSQVLEAQYNNDIAALLECCNSRNKKIADDAYKALFAYANLDGLSLNDIVKYYNIAKGNPALEQLFGEMYEKKKQALYESYKYKTVKAVMEEARYSPEKKELISDFIRDNIGSHLDELTYNDLTYLHNELPDYMFSDVQNERNSRTAEKQALVKSCVSQYCDLETQHIKKFCYVFEKSMWEYLYLNYGRVIVEYANHELPESAEAMAKQYRTYVKNEFSEAKFKSFMQGELDKFCAEINKVRSSYASQCGRTDYVKLSLEMPVVKFSNYSASDDNLQKIIDEKASYKESTKTVDMLATGANLVSWFFDGGVVSNLLITGAKHLITSGLADDMAEKVLEARKMYVSDVLKAMEYNGESQFASVENALKQQLIDNEKTFRNDVEK